VAAGTGPAVRALAAELAEWRRVAALHGALEHARQQRDNAELARRQAGYAAIGKTGEADSVSWLRPSRKEQLRAEAAHLHQQAQAARAVGQQWADEVSRLSGELGTHRHSPDPAETLRRAEQGYPRERAHAQARDDAELDRLARAGTFHDDQAAHHGTRHAQLAAEKTTRADMGQTQRGIEQAGRDRWAAQQHRQAEREHAERSRRDNLDFDTGVVRGHDHGHDYGYGRGHDGPGLGL
jgi:hypothetical protein